MVGTRPLRAKRDSEGPGKLSPTEAWNQVHLLLHPALTLSGPEALGSRWHLHRGVAGPPIRTVPDHSPSTSGPKVNPASPLPCMRLFLVGSNWRWACPLQRGPPTPSQVPPQHHALHIPPGDSKPSSSGDTALRGWGLISRPSRAPPPGRSSTLRQRPPTRAPGLHCTQL